MCCLLGDGAVLQIVYGWWHGCSGLLIIANVVWSDRQTTRKCGYLDYSTQGYLLDRWYVEILHIALYMCCASPSSGLNMKLICLKRRHVLIQGFKDGVDMSRPLTRSHFVIGRGSAFEQVSHEGNHNITADDLVLREHIKTKAIDTFWAVCWDDYIRHLPPCRGQMVEGHVVPGSVVLIRYNGCARLFLPLRLITEVFPV